jgi:peptidoglycan/xylan/chitin deacetylase (PgdA/CDA1 family)
MTDSIDRRLYDRLAALCGRAPVDRLRVTNRNAVLMYHSVRSAADCRPGTSDVAVTEFRRQLDYLTSHHDVVDLPAVKESDGRGEGKKVALTFDDGYRDFYTNVRPLLHEYDVPATVFVVAGFVGDADRRTQVANTGHLFDTLTSDQLADLAADSLVTIGNHSRTHHDLGRHEDREIIRDEVVSARHELEDRFGVTVDRFCYPRGGHNTASCEVVRESHALATVDESQRPLLDSEDPVRLPRIDAGLPFPLVRFRLSDANGALMRLLGRGPTDPPPASNP